MTTPPSTSTNDPYAAWRNGNYRLYALGWFLLVFGKAAETIAVQVHLYERTKDPLSLGLMGLVQAMPIILFAIGGGHLADRFDRRRVMMSTMSVNVVISLGLLLAAREDVPVSWFYPLLFIGATSTALGTPSRSALLPQLVRPENFSNAVTWSSTVFQIGTMTGPVVAGFLIGSQVNTSRALTLVVVCRLLSLAAIAGMRHRKIERQDEALTWQSLMAGVRFVFQTKLILATITLDLFAVLLGGAVYLLPIFARDILGVGATGLGFLRAADAIGAISMAVLLAHLPPMKHAGRTLLWAVAGFGLCTILFGLSKSFWPSLAMLFMVGGLDAISVVVRHSLVQLLTPDRMRGRVSAVNSVFIVASNDIGGLESGVTARLFGPVASVVLGGVGTLLVVIGAARIWPQILSIGSLHDIRPADAPEEIERTAAPEMVAVDARETAESDEGHTTT